MVGISQRGDCRGDIQGGRPLGGGEGVTWGMGADYCTGYIKPQLVLLSLGGGGKAVLMLRVEQTSSLGGE